VHLLAAVTHVPGLVIGQDKVAKAGKANEVTHFRPLLEPLPLDGVLITTDAMQATRDNALFLRVDLTVFPSANPLPSTTSATRAGTPSARRAPAARWPGRRAVRCGITARPGEWTQIDSTPLDVRVVHDDGTVDRADQPGRPGHPHHHRGGLSRSFPGGGPWWT